MIITLLRRGVASCTWLTDSQPTQYGTHSQAFFNRLLFNIYLLPSIEWMLTSQELSHPQAYLLLVYWKLTLTKTNQRHWAVVLVWKSFAFLNYRKIGLQSLSFLWRKISLVIIIFCLRENPLNFDRSESFLLRYNKSILGCLICLKEEIHIYLTYTSHL